MEKLRHRPQVLTIEPSALTVVSALTILLVVLLKLGWTLLDSVCRLVVVFLRLRLSLVVSLLCTVESPVQTPLRRVRLLTSMGLRLLTALVVLMLALSRIPPALSTASGAFLVCGRV